jgi:hypothetical protein
MSLLYTSFPQRLGVSNPTATISSNTCSPNASVSTLNLADKKEIHEAKMGASFWAGVFGPFKPLWDFLFYNPNKAAKKRLDVKSGQRSELAGEALEADKKKAQLKAALIPCLIRSVTAFTIPLPGLIGAVIAPLAYLFFEKPEAPDFNEKL